jgi:hypothetical protein
MLGLQMVLQTPQRLTPLSPLQLQTLLGHLLQLKLQAAGLLLLLLLIMMAAAAATAAVCVSVPPAL